MRLLRVDHLTSEYELERAPAADHAGKPNRAAVSRDDAELDLRQSELRVLTCHPEMTSECQLQAATQCEPIHGGDYRFTHRFQKPERVLPLPPHLDTAEWRHLRQLRDVSPRDKGFFACSSQDDRAHCVILRHLFQGDAQLIHGFRIQRVEFVRAVDGNNPYIAT